VDTLKQESAAVRGVLNSGIGKSRWGGWSGAPGSQDNRTKFDDLIVLASISRLGPQSLDWWQSRNRSEMDSM